MERLEQREQAINKRQSALDRRVNEVEKAYSQQMVELQRIAQMTVEEARAVVLAEAEKEGRSGYGPHHPPDRSGSPRGR